MFAQVPGRKHHHVTRNVQEDAASSQTIQLAGGEWIFVACVCDGHGVTFSGESSASKESPKFARSGAERFQNLLLPLIPTTVSKLFNEALRESSDNANLIINEIIQKKLETLNEILDSKMIALDTHLCKENGSTLSLVILFRTYLFACNIGDSQILLFDRDLPSALPLKIWKLQRHTTFQENSGANDISENNRRIPKKNFAENDNNSHACSFPDSLFIQEGTLQKYITEEYTHLRERAVKAGGGGPSGGYIHSTKSKYRLGMTCSIGNMSHKENLLIRTNVYCFNLPELFEILNAGRLLVVITSDGIKDLVKSNFIGQAFTNLPKTIRAMSAVVSGNQSSSRKTLKACMQDLIPRATEDVHDKNAKLHLDQLVALLSVEKNCIDDDSHSRKKSADSLYTLNSEGITDLRIAIEALCDLAILKGSTDDITVMAFQISSYVEKYQNYYSDTRLPLSDYAKTIAENSLRDFVWVDGAWALMESIEHRQGLEIPERPVFISPLREKILEAVSKHVETKKITVVLEKEEISSREVAVSIESELGIGMNSVISFGYLHSHEITQGWGISATPDVGFSFGRIAHEDIEVPLFASNMELDVPVNINPEETNSRKRKL
ncbi:hypothetical protein HK100_007232 [Physocladia obscura]|uniref:PPM-type phosphatase domain-containing protein n=1 Tax=Physocladia obscura TaxID=109957 RepID=A0AAD5TA66_9FUNG|nr:hypothetical protein HK100_007232 [Physocladia obscura]